MATSALCGSGGVVTGFGSVTEVTKWTIEQTVEALDATSMASAGWKERIACLKGATGTISCIGVAPTVGPDAAVTLKTSATGYSISGAIIVSKVTINTPVEGVVSFDADFVFTGTITVA